LYNETAYIGMSENDMKRRNLGIFILKISANDEAYNCSSMAHYYMIR